MIEKFKSFILDTTADDMFIVGRAGTGKTTSLYNCVEWLSANNMPYIVCAFTHKAVEVLVAKLPADAQVVTLHSFLKKRPVLNQHAVKLAHIDTNSAALTNSTDLPAVIFIDEFSMVGEKDYMDIIALQEADENKHMKVVYIGDPYQLPPVGDMQTIVPSPPYIVTLTKVHRTNRVDLLEAMTTLVSYIEKKAPFKPIQCSEHLVRGVDIVKQYKSSKNTDKILLAWTNMRVQQLNSEIAGKDKPEVGDVVWNFSTRQKLKLLGFVDKTEVDSILVYNGELELCSKYRTLEHLKTLDEVIFIRVVDEQDIESTRAIIFGSYNFKLVKAAYRNEAVTANSKISSKYKGSPAIWAKANSSNKLAKVRSKAWRDLLTFESCINCVDFTFAHTVHKSQGATYDEVYIDTNNLAMCGKTNLTLYTKLLYVAISRAGSLVYTN